MRRRVTVLALAITIGLAGAAGAQATAVASSSVPDSSLTGSVHDVTLDEWVRPIDLDASIVDLRSEEQRGGETVVTISADVLFAFDSAELTETAHREIAAVAAHLTGLASSAAPILVDGYTDAFGTPAYNVILSQRRASAVADQLRPAAPVGVRVSATGHGSADPIARNTALDGSDDPAGRARNRRVTITYPAA